MHSVDLGVDGFASDNERPAHLEVAAFGMARRPATNATRLGFVEGGR